MVKINAVCGPGRVCAYCLTADESERLVQYANRNFLITDHFLEWLEQTRNGDVDAKIPGDVRTFIIVCNQISGAYRNTVAVNSCSCDQ